jgi:site-specific recombinase XerD
MAPRADAPDAEGPKDGLGFPDASELAAFRATAEGLDSRVAVERYAPHLLGDGKSARAVISRTRRLLQRIARLAGRDDLAELLDSARSRPGARRAARISSVIEELRSASQKQPMIGDAVEDWFASRLAAVLRAAGIKTLAALTLRVPRRRRWWVSVPGLGSTSARRVEAFFAAHPDLTERARALAAPAQVGPIAPWETLVVPGVLDGSRGQFRAQRESCVLSASNDYEAVQAWIERHEAESTQRAYKKEAERLILWAVVLRGKALSSLTAEDATAYRAFLRNPTPKARWVGPARARTSPDWRPFVGPLAATSVKYAVSVLGALFRWLVEQHYVVANPFAGLKVRGGTASSPADAGRVFTQAEWRLIRVVADGLEWSYGWSKDAAHRLRFVLDFGRGTGLRPSELCDATMGDIFITELNDGWIDVVGKGAKKAKVSVPPLVRAALSRYLTHCGIPTSPNLWHPETPLVATLSAEVGCGITPARLLDILDRFYETAARVVFESNPPLAEKLRSATTHWMRHTHATHALELGVPLLAVRDNLRHASVATTSNYLHSDAAKRAAELAKAFGVADA